VLPRRSFAAQVTSFLDDQTNKTSLAGMSGEILGHNGRRIYDRFAPPFRSFPSAVPLPQSRHCLFSRYLLAKRNLEALDLLAEWLDDQGE